MSGTYGSETYGSGAYGGRATVDSGGTTPISVSSTESGVWTRAVDESFRANRAYGAGAYGAGIYGGSVGHLTPVRVTAADGNAFTRETVPGGVIDVPIASLATDVVAQAIAPGGPTPIRAEPLATAASAVLRRINIAVGTYTRINLAAGDIHHRELPEDGEADNGAEE